MPQAVVPTIRFDDLYKGWEIPHYYWAVTPNEMKAFAQVVGCPDPLFMDENEAKKMGLDTIAAHPGYINLFHFECNLLRGAHNNPVFPTMHNASKVEFFRPIYPGDILTIKMRVHDKIISKKGRRFVAWEIELLDKDGNLVARKIHSSMWLKDDEAQDRFGITPGMGPRPLY